MKGLSTILSILFMPIACLSLLLPVYGSTIRLTEGVTLFYNGTSKSTSGQGNSETWATSTKILILNQTTLVFQSNSSSAPPSSGVTILYQDGIPSYADYLTALIYLPPECIARSLQGNLNWTKQIGTRTLASVAEGTSQTLNFTVQAGTFQSINITLALTGVEFGTLTFIYDVASGVLIYEQWVPSYGDIIVLSLMAATNSPEIQQTIFSLILPAATLVIPAATATHQTRRWLKRRSRMHEKQPEKANLKSGFPRKPFYAILVGASLNLASVFLPWTQFVGLQIYLPLSLPSALTGSSGPFASVSSSAAISLIAHAAAILAWVSIAIHLYTTKKLAPQLVAIASGILAFASAAIFIQTGWASSWGLLTTVIGAILTIAATAVANIKIEITIEEQEEPEDTSTP